MVEAISCVFSICDFCQITRVFFFLKRLKKIFKLYNINIQLHVIISDVSVFVSYSINSLDNPDLTFKAQ